jgi:hypothetical protein
MTTARTPYSHPENFNRTDRAPNESGDFDPATEEFLTAPRLLERTQALIQQGRLHPADANHMLVALRRHYRALNGDRSRPGEYLGTTALPTEPMPFAEREEVHPEYAPGTHKGNVMRRAVERMDADRIQDGLLATMRENDQAKAPPAERAAQESNEPPSLRDSIQASVDALGG